MKILLIVILFVFSDISTKAQDKILFSSKNYVGLLEGEDGSQFQLQTINGFNYKAWFVGLGTGLDWYYQRTIPLFASLNRDFLKKEKRNFYLSADGGINFPWQNNNYYYEWGYGDGKFYPGLYWSAGLGYKIGLGKNADALLMHLGYSYKQLAEKVVTVLPCFNPPCPESTDRFDFRLRRLSLKVGWSF